MCTRNLCFKRTIFWPKNNFRILNESYESYEFQTRGMLEAIYTMHALRHMDYFIRDLLHSNDGSALYSFVCNCHKNRLIGTSRAQGETELNSWLYATAKTPESTSSVNRLSVTHLYSFACNREPPACLGTAYTRASETGAIVSDFSLCIAI